VDLDEDLGLDGLEVEARHTAEGLPLEDLLDRLVDRETALEEEEVTAHRTVEDLPCSAPMGIFGTMNGNSIAN
jgi:hypothetical protein